MLAVFVYLAISLRIPDVLSGTGAIDFTHALAVLHVRANQARCLPIRPCFPSSLSTPLLRYLPPHPPYCLLPRLLCLKKKLKKKTHIIHVLKRLANSAKQEEEDGTRSPEATVWLTLSGAVQRYGLLEASLSKPDLSSLTFRIA
eukprot:1028659-Rhodomonas_salina.2